MVAPRSTTGADCGGNGMVTCAPAVAATSNVATATREKMFIVGLMSAVLLSGATRRTIGCRVGFGSGGVHRLDQLGALARDLRAERGVLLQREVAAAVHPGLLGPGELRARVAAPDHEVGVLARLERADPVVDRDGLGRVDRDGIERLDLGETRAQQLP